MSETNLRPMGLGEILDRALTLYRSDVSGFAGTVAVPVLVMTAATISVQVLQYAVLGIQPGEKAEPADLAASVVLVGVGGVALGLISVVANAIAAAAVTLSASEAHFGRPVTVRETYRKVWPRLGGLIALMLLIGIRVACLVLLAGVGGFAAGGLGAAGSAALVGPIAALILLGGAVGVMVVLFIRYSVAFQALLLEDVGAREALKRSVFLTRGNYGRIFVVLLFAAVLGWAGAAIFQAPFYLAGWLVPAFKDSPLMTTILAQVSGSLGSILVLPISMIAFALLYYDTRVRKEALDLQILMAEAGRAARPAAGPTA